MIKSTRQHRREARLLWQSVTVDGLPDAERIREAVQTLPLRIGRDAEAVLRCFAERLAVYVRFTQINIVSADPLSLIQQQQLAQLMSTATALNPEIRFSVDASVLGGLRLEQGYMVTDRTIARQLNVVQTLLLKH